MNTEQLKVGSKLVKKEKQWPRKCRTKYCRNQLYKTQRDYLCSKCKMRKWRAQNPIKASYSALKNNAKRRKVFFDLSYEQFCFLVSQLGYIWDKGREKFCMTLDRIDPSKGYTYSNIQVLTNQDNGRKGAYERADRIGKYVPQSQSPHISCREDDPF